MKYAFKIFISILLAGQVYAQEISLGLLFKTDKAYEGYTLFWPNSSRTTYLIDNCGFKVHEWEGEGFPEIMNYLLEDGSLLRMSAGFIEKLGWDSEQLWRYSTEELGTNHHDIEPLPNGNVLVIITEYKTTEEAIAQGRSPGLLEDEFGVDAIFEIKPTGSESGDVVWKWSFWDHLVQDADPEKDNFGAVEDNPRKLNINFNDLGEPYDWLHVNSVSYNESLDQVVLSSRHTSELYIIDHSISTEEAAGEKGDFLWRWGNDKVYRKGTGEDQKLYQQHDPQWIPAGFNDEGKITVFNNLAEFDHQGEPFSQIHIIDTKINSEDGYDLTNDGTFGPEDFTFTYTGEVLGKNFWSEIESGVSMLPNGNFLACLAVGGRFVEVTRDGEVVWVYQNPVAFEPLPQFADLEEFLDVFRAERYPIDFSGFEGRNLAPMGTVEDRNPISNRCAGIVTSVSDNVYHELAFPNPVANQVTLTLGRPFVPADVVIHDVHGKVVQVRPNLDFDDHTLRIDFNQNLLPGHYYLTLKNNKDVLRFRLLVN